MLASSRRALSPGALSSRTSLVYVYIAHLVTSLSGHAVSCQPREHHEPVSPNLWNVVYSTQAGACTPSTESMGVLAMTRQAVLSTADTHVDM